MSMDFSVLAAHFVQHTRKTTGIRCPYWTNSLLEICFYLLISFTLLWGEKPELRKSHSRYLVTQQGLISFTYYDTLFTWHIVTYSLMAQRVVDDYNFIADVWKIMTDKVSLMLSYFFCFYFTFLINNSWNKITVLEKYSLFHQPLHTLLISAYNF